MHFFETHDQIISKAIQTSDIERKEELEQGSKRKWRTYESTIEQYDKTFEVDLPKGIPLIQDELNSFNGIPTVLDLCSGPHALRSIRQPINGLAVGLVDPRVDENEVQKDRDRRITVIGSKSVRDRTGDLFVKNTWNAIDFYLGERGADIIICRPQGGYSSLMRQLGYDFELDFVENIAQRLAPQGRLFIQLFNMFNPKHVHILNKRNELMSQRGYSIIYVQNHIIDAIKIIRD